MNRKTTSSKPSKQQRAAKAKQAKGNASQMHWSREGIESSVIAVILALLFRTFEAEAFVIPTGSMAPTLQGRHKDVKCDQCGYSYRTGASLGHEMSSKGPVVETTCPMCRYGLRIDPNRSNHGSFSGDRILVNKFAYQFGEPQRWDVIVFKFPGNAKQNYIKRLVGLPGETLKIQHGDVFSEPQGTSGFQIARKSPAKLQSMLQLVSDSNRIPESLVKIDWPMSWSDLEETGNWSVSEDRHEYTLSPNPTPSWLRYRHIVPSRNDWVFIRNNNRPPDLSRKQGNLITDYYAYNDFRQLRTDPLSASQSALNVQQSRHLEEIARQMEFHNAGMHWVGDLALECDVKISSDAGALLLDLVESGVHYTCRIDVASGQAQLSIDGDAEFSSVDGKSPEHLTAETKVKGPGKYRIRFANVDEQLVLWVGRSAVHWKVNGNDHPAHTVTHQSRPVWSEDDPGDLAPLGIGGEDIEMVVSTLRVLRDIYYVAAKSKFGAPPEIATDYKQSEQRFAPQDVARIFADPSVWASPIVRSTSVADVRVGEIPGSSRG
jgi:signal peptidase I